MSDDRKRQGPIGALVEILRRPRRPVDIVVGLLALALLALLVVGWVAEVVLSRRG